MQDETIRQVSPHHPVKPVRQLYLQLVYPLLGEAGRPHRFARIGSRLDVGRETVGETAFQVPVGTVSRCHFTIESDNAGWILTDCDSANGTRLNGALVRRARVFEQDVIRAGGAVFVATASQPLDLGWLSSFGVVGCSGAMARVSETCRTTTKDMSNVLILGETGTGKDVVASMLHRTSGRAGNFVPVNCGAIPEQLLESTLFGWVKGAFTGADADHPGLLQEAAGGTLLLDEIAELPQALQVKLLRTLEERTYMPVGSTRAIPFDVKVLAATNRLDSIQDPTSGFRQDLLARFEDLVIYLPPLRQRREEIVLLMQSCLKEFRTDIPYDPGLIEAIVLYEWPRNTRQLLKTVRQVLKSNAAPEAINAEALCLYLGTWPDGHKSTDSGSGATTRVGISTSSSQIVATPKTRRDGPPAQEEFEKVLEQCEYNVSAMARHYSCDRRQIYRWLEHFGIERTS